MTSRRVGVVGGGVAGISAALALADAGVHVTLLERRPHLGGLTTSIERDGVSFDNGQHVFLGCCSAYLSFLERLGASRQVFRQERLDVPVLSPDGTVHSITRSSLPVPLHLAWSLARYRYLSLKERFMLARAVLALGRLDRSDPSLDTVSFGDWLRDHGQSQRAIDRLWNLIIQPTVNVTANESSLALAAQVFQVGFLESSSGADVGWSVVPLATLHGTNAERALRDALVDVRLNTAATSVAPAPGGFTVETDGESLTFDAVIVATSPRVATALGALSEDPPVAEQMGASPIVNIHFVLDRRVTDLRIAACIDSPIEFLFDRTDSSGVVDGQCLTVSLSAADRYVGVGSSELVPRFFEALGDLFPRARDATLISAVVTREHAATFRGTPGIESVRPPSSTAVAGLFLAGAWCRTGWPATMEGAVRSGNEAAAMALCLLADATGDGAIGRERVGS